MIDHDLKEKILTLSGLDLNNQFKLIYMWVKQDVITFGQFKELINECIDDKTK